MCPTCAHAPPEVPRDTQIYEFLYKEGRAYSHTCEVGHEFRFDVDITNFGALFEIAAHAVVDGYYREAVLSAHAAMERFNEFFVRTVCRDRKIAQAEVEKAWKHPLKQSERQLGAYYAAHLLYFGRAAQQFPEEATGFRNKVVHQGVIPTREEAIEHAEKALNLIQQVHWDLFQTAEEVMREMEREELANQAVDLAGPIDCHVGYGTLVRRLPSDPSEYSDSRFAEYVGILEAVKLGAPRFTLVK